MKGIIASLLLSAASTAIASDAYYAFYNEIGCKGDHGTHVDTNNHACFQEHGRLSAGPVGGGGGFYIPLLIAYSDDNCQTPLGCANIAGSPTGPGPGETEGCVNFSADPKQSNQYWANKANSFKFVSGESNNCPGHCVGPYKDGGC